MQHQSQAGQLDFCQPRVAELPDWFAEQIMFDYVYTYIYLCYVRLYWHGVYEHVCVYTNNENITCSLGHARVCFARSTC